MQMREQWHVKVRDENPWQRGRQAAVCAWVCKTEGDNGRGSDTQCDAEYQIDKTQRVSN